MTRFRIIVAAVVLAFLVQASALAAPRVLVPGVTYDRVVQQTPSGPVVMHVVTAPRPGGLYALTPVLGNGTIVGRETVTGMQQRLAAGATMVGVNGDLFELASGRPSGIVVQGSALVHPPANNRASLTVGADGTLSVGRLSFSARWQGSGPRRVLHDLNRAPAANRLALFTSAWGPATPAVPGAAVAVLSPLPLTTPNVDLAAPVTQVLRTSASVAIPRDGAVLVARGTAAAALEAEALVGAQVVVSLALRPDPGAIASAFGGGPQLVRDGQPVFRANEDFSSASLGRRNPRSAVGQKADGSLLFVVVDGRQPGVSIGVTSWELAKAMVALGAVTASALDSGGSSALAFDGALLSTPSDPGGERAVAEGLMLSYAGVYVLPDATPVPGVASDSADVPLALRYKVVRPSAVTATLRTPGGVVAFSETASREPGLYDVPLTAAPTPAGAQASVRSTLESGRWTLDVEAVDDLGQASRMSRSVVVNRTVAGLRFDPPRLFLPPGGRDVAIAWQQTVKARVVVTVEARDGTVVRTLATRRYDVGEPTVVWNGLDRERKRVKGGIYLVRVVAKNRFGTLDTTQRLWVRQIAGPPRG